MGVLLLLSTSLCDTARSDEPVYEIDIPSMNAAQALNRFAEQTGVIMLFSYDLASARRANAVRGRYTLLEGLELLLRDSGLSGGLSNKRVVNISPAGNSQRSGEETPVTHEKTSFRKRITSFFAAMLAASGASGQEANEIRAPEVVTDVVVTGSRLGRDGFRAPTPVTVLSSADMEAQAPKNISDFVNQVPSLAGSMTQTTRAIQMSNGTTGISAPALRGLGSNRTLVLLDGQRSVPVTQTGETDIENFPQQLISRVDVVTGGASAAYGSDALAGVINFVLDHKFTGFKGEVAGGATHYGDDRDRRIALSGGFGFAEDRGHVILSGEYQENSGVLGNDMGHPPERDWQYAAEGVLLNPAYTATNGQPEYIRVPRYVTAAAVRGAIIHTGPLRGTAFTPDGTPYQFNYGTLGLGNTYMSGGDYQNADMSGTMTLDPETSRKSIFGRLSYDISESISIFGQAQYARSSARSHHSTPAELGTLLIRADNAFLPASVAARAQALGVTSFQIGRFQEGGRLGAYVEREVQRYVVGANGEFGMLGSEWDWSAYYQKGIAAPHETVFNNRVQARFIQSVDAVTNPATGAIVCRSTLTNPNDGCVPYNVFRFGETDPRTRAYVYGTSWRDQTFEQDVAAATLRGAPYSLWAGPVSLAAGIEHRRESTRGSTDPISAASGWGQGNFLPLNGSYNVTEGFVEIGVPLAEDLPFAKALDLNGAVRATDYSVSGYVTTWKAGLTWSPIDDIRLRLTRSRDIRAPNLSELFSRGLIQTVAFRDPVANLPSVFAFQVTTGNLELEPEKADTLGLGVVLQPSFIPGLSASVDYYEIEIEDAIGTVAAQQIVDQCFAGVQVFCSSIERGLNNGVNTITRVFNRPFNFVDQVARGLDFDISYRTPADRLFSGAPGTLILRGLATRFLESARNNGITPKVDSVGEMIGGVLAATPSTGGIPNWKYSASLTYDASALAVTLTGRGVSSNHISSSYIECTSGCPTSTASFRTINNKHVAGAFYLDAAITYRSPIGGNLELFVSARNVFNKDPAVVPRGPAGLSYGDRATNLAVYDVLGRMYRAGARFSF